MPIPEPQTPAQVAALAQDLDRYEMLMHQQRDNEHIQALNPKSPEFHDRLSHYVNVLLMQGRHKDAEKWAFKAEHVERIKAHKQAIDCDDDECCDCKHEPTIEALTQHEIVAKSWDDDLKAIRYHFYCRYCGHTNAKRQAPHPAHGVIEKHRKQNAKIIEEAMKRGWKPQQGRPAGLVSDEQVLAEVKALNQPNDQNH